MKCVCEKIFQMLDSTFHVNMTFDLCFEVRLWKSNFKWFILHLMLIWYLCFLLKYIHYCIYCNLGDVILNNKFSTPPITQLFKTQQLLIWDMECYPKYPNVLSIHEKVRLRNKVTHFGWTRMNIIDKKSKWLISWHVSTCPKKIGR